MASGLRAVYGFVFLFVSTVNQSSIRRRPGCKATHRPPCAAKRFDFGGLGLLFQPPPPFLNQTNTSKGRLLTIFVHVQHSECTISAWNGCFFGQPSNYVEVDGW